MSATSVTNRNRITAIDALRGITLLGILLVHTANTFGNNLAFFDEANQTIRDLIYNWLDNRCNTVFTMLFGCSFWFILRKKDYPVGKFVWRCILLMFIGLVLKCFYTYEALFWFGVCGIFLCIFKNVSNKALLILSIAVFVIYLIIGYIQSLMPAIDEHQDLRYVPGATILTVIKYPVWNSVNDYMTVVTYNGFLSTLSRMLFGYWLAKSGIIFKLKDISRFKWILLWGAIYFAYYLTKRTLFVNGCLAIESVRSVMECVTHLGNLFGSFFYSVLFLNIYFKLPSFFAWSEKYGAMGLTNYFFQGVFGVTALYVIALPRMFSFNMYLVLMLSIYIFQTIFSMFWLNAHRFGPLEFLWRKATNLYGYIIKPKE